MTTDHKSDQAQREGLRYVLYRGRVDRRLLSCDGETPGRDTALAMTLGYLQLHGYLVASTDAYGVGHTDVVEVSPAGHVRLAELDRDYRPPHFFERADRWRSRLETIARDLVYCGYAGKVAAIAASEEQERKRRRETEVQP